MGPQAPVTIDRVFIRDSRPIGKIEQRPRSKKPRPRSVTVMEILGWRVWLLVLRCVQCQIEGVRENHCRIIIVFSSAQLAVHSGLPSRPQHNAAYVFGSSNVRSIFSGMRGGDELGALILAHVDILPGNSCLQAWKDHYLSSTREDHEPRHACRLLCFRRAQRWRKISNAGRASPLQARRSVHCCWGRLRRERWALPDFGWTWWPPFN